MQPVIIKPRRPWLAAFLSQFFGPIGQIYAGHLRRSIVLWLVGALLYILLSFLSVTIRIQSLGIVLIMLCMVSFQIFLAVDAYLLAKRNRETPLKQFQRPWVYCIAIIMYIFTFYDIMIAVRMFIVESFSVPSKAMSPTIQPGDRIMVDKLWCSPANLKRNDIVVYRGEGQKLLITRLVGLPGDEIQVKEEQLFVNGSRCEDQHAFFNGSSTHLPPELVNYGPIKVPLDSFFVLGDNRRISIDSRRLGPIPLSKLHGKAFVIFWSQEMTNLAPLNSSEYPLGPIRWDRIGRRLD